jgi:AcrR family transcriptional regulator
MPKHKSPDNETHTRLLDIAEALFAQRGLAAVKLREIADAVGIHHASLYYYAPGGKEQLYVEVMERNALRHRRGLTAALEDAEDDLRAKLYAVAGWLISQTPLNAAGMAFSDLPSLNPIHAERIARLSYEAICTPIAAALKPYRDQLALSDLNEAAMILASLVQSAHLIPDHQLSHAQSRVQIAQRYVEMLLNGWIKR